MPHPPSQPASLKASQKGEQLFFSHLLSLSLFKMATGVQQTLRKCTSTSDEVDRVAGALPGTESRAHGLVSSRSHPGS